MTEKVKQQDTKQSPPAEESSVEDVRANETPIERARRLGQGDDVDPSIPTNQTPAQTADNIPAHDSNEELRIAGDKRSEAEVTDRGQRGDARGQTTR